MDAVSTLAPGSGPRHWLVLAMPVDRSIRVGMCLQVQGHAIGMADGVPMAAADKHAPVGCPR